MPPLKLEAGGVHLVTLAIQDKRDPSLRQSAFKRDTYTHFHPLVNPGTFLLR